jgi:hypothetical protein
LPAVPPESRPIPRFAAEPPQESLPYGRWGEALAERFLAACADVDAGEEDLGEPSDIAWFPDRTYAGRTYLPAAASTSTGAELFGFVSYRRAREDAEPTDFEAFADATTETAARNPDWQLDLSDHELERWRGPEGRRGIVTLVWGRALVAGGALATAELGPTTTDQCPVVDDRFTLVSLDDYTGDLLEVRVYGRGGGELARESLYEGE